MSFSRELIPRLTYAKQMYLHGYEHGKKPGNLNKSFAIIAIDGAIEIFLGTIVTEFNASSKIQKRPNFLDILAVADNAIGNSLPLKNEVQKIHNIRNAAQHQGIIPSEHDIQSSLIYAEDFLSQACSLYFKVNFKGICLSDLIIDPELHESIKEVEKRISIEDYINAMNEAALTFDMLKNKYKKYYGDSAINRGHHFVIDFIFSIHDMEDSSAKTKAKRHTLEKIIVSLLDEIDRITDRVYAISLGANVQDYLFFRKNTPRPVLTMKGYRFVSSEPIEYSKEKSIRIFNFLHNVIVQWESLKE